MPQDNARRPRRTPIYLVLDAVDECLNTSGMPSPREKVLRLVKELVELKLSNLHLCITSRPEIDIRNALEPLAAHRISLHDESGQNADIANYVSSVVYSDSRMRRWRAEERDLVVGRLSAKADGMFRWVFCQLEILRHCFPASVLNILEQLPESLDETYERILREISRANRDHAYRLLQCLTVAVRHFESRNLPKFWPSTSTREEARKLNADWRWEDNEEAVLSACSSLVAVVIDGDSRVVQFSHFSVKEFLTSNRLATSLGVLLRLDEQVDRDSIVGFPLAQYAAEHWPEHVNFENVLSHVKDGVDELFEVDKPHFAAWVWLHKDDGPSMAGTSPSPPEAPPLYYAVRIGNRALIERALSKRPQDVSVKGGYYGTPLHAAFSKRDIETVWLLLENGADVNIRAYEDRTPLQCASYEGFPDVTRWLLRRGVDVNAQDEDQWTALHYAGVNGHLEVAEILLEHGAEVNASQKNDCVPLHYAAQYGYLELARLLLKHGGNSNARNRFGRTPADEASARGHTEIVELLSEHVAVDDAHVGERDEFNTIVEQYGNYYWCCTPYPSRSPLLCVPSPNYLFLQLRLYLQNCLQSLQKRTGQDITSHPLAARLKTCDSPDAILAVLKAQVEEFDQSRRDDERLTNWLNPTVNVLYAFSATLGEGVGLVFSPAKVIFAGFGVLLLASKDVAASHDVLIDIFERIENFFKRLEAYTEVPQTAAMTTLSICELVGRQDIEDALQKLDRLTQEEARMATAEVLRVTHGVDDKVKGVGFQVEGVNKGVQDVDGKVECVDERVQGVDERVQGVDERVQGVDERVQGVDERVQRVGDGVHGVDERVRGVGVDVQRVDHKVRAVDDRVKQVDHRVAVVNDDVKLIIDGVRKETTAALQRIVNTVDDMSRNQLRRDLRNWISPPIHPSIITPPVVLITRVPRHGSLEATPSKLGGFMAAYSGSGKSILSSVIVRDIEDICNAGFASMAYFYFDFKDTAKQDSRALLSSLLIQLSDPPNDGALTQCLKTMLVALGETPIYLILDAVDECVNTSGMPSPREKVLIFVEELVELKLSNLHLCITSRPEIDIRNALEPLAVHRISLHDESGQNADIATYVSSVVYSDSRMRRWRAEERDLVVGRLSAKADGMFRWVFCQLEILRHCFPASVLNILEQLPESLDETYERILREISRANRDHAYHLLQCLTVAVRPLRVEELAEILAVDFNASGGPNLVAVVMDGDYRVVQFSHFSVKEFLTSDRLASSLGKESRFHIRLESAHTILAQASLGVLLRLDEQVDRDSIVGFPLPNTQQSTGPSTDKPTQPEAPPLYYAALIGNRALVEQRSSIGTSRLWLLLENGADLNVWGSGGNTPLHLASDRGFPDVVRWLLDRGLDLEAKETTKSTALHLAACAGRLEVAEILLEHNAEVEARDNRGRVPLHDAARDGHLELVRLLLKHGGNVNAPATMARLRWTRPKRQNTQRSSKYYPSE
ncbi:hypothetical protein EDB85DRAFT_2142480 [Lactarius pseudohatsudake]|nr:hypothetical protein EDB85DRAFT_2142480 [Lactarius pseudohatsudake]